MQSFPPKNVLNTVKSIKVQVRLDGDGMPMMDKVLKQVVQGELSNSGVKVMYGDEDSGAVLFCRITSIVLRRRLIRSPGRVRQRLLLQFVDRPAGAAV